ncbi:unnamed protein product [Cunninghamella echinulata]
MDDINNNTINNNVTDDDQLVYNTFYALVTIIPVSLLFTIIVMITHFMLAYYYKYSEVNRISLRLIVLSSLFNFIRYIIRLAFIQNTFSLACTVTIILMRWLDNITLLCIALVSVHSVAVLVLDIHYPLLLEKYYYLFIALISITDIVLSSLIRFEILNNEVETNCWLYAYFDYTKGHHNLRIWYVGLLLFIIGLSALCSLSLLIQYILEITNPIETPLHYIQVHFDSFKVYRQVIIQNLCCSLALLFCGILTIICEFRLDLYNSPPPGLVTAAFAFSALQGTLIGIIYFIDPGVNLCLKKFRKYLRKVYIDEYNLPEKGKGKKYSNECYHDIIHTSSMAGLPSTSMHSAIYGFRGGYDVGKFGNTLNLQKKVNPYRWPWLAQILHFILSHIFCMKPRHHQKDNTTYNMAHTITPTPTSLYTFNNNDITPIHDSNHLNSHSTNSIHPHSNDNDSNNYRKSTYSSKSAGMPIIKNIDSILPPLHFGDDPPLTPIVLNASHTCDNNNNNSGNSNDSSDNDNNNKDRNKGKSKLKIPIPSPPLDLLNLYDNNAFPSSSSLLPPDQCSDFYDLSILTDSSSSLHENKNNNNSINNNNISVDNFNVDYPKNGSNRVYPSALRNSGNLSITSLPPTYPQNTSEGPVDDFKKSFLHRILHHYQPQPKVNNESSISINSVASSPTMPHHRHHHHHHQQFYSSPSSLPPPLPSQSSSCTSSPYQRVSFLQLPPLRRINSPSILGRAHSSSSTLSFHSQETADKISTILSNRTSSIVTGSMDDYYNGLNVPSFQYYQQVQQKDENKKIPENNHHDHFFKRKKKIKSNDKTNHSNNKLLKLSTNGSQFSYIFTTASQRHSKDSVILSPTTVKTLMSYDDSSYKNDEDLHTTEKDGLIHGWSMIIHIKSEQLEWDSTTLNDQQQKKNDSGDDDSRIFTLLEYWNRNYAGSRWFVVE